MHLHETLAVPYLKDSFLKEFVKRELKQKRHLNNATPVVLRDVFSLSPSKVTSHLHVEGFNYTAYKQTPLLIPQ